jgi:HK97 family phage portal protein
MRNLVSALTGALSRPKEIEVRNDAPVPYTSNRGALFETTSDLPHGDAAYEAYGSVGTLFAIVTQITNAFASVEWHLYRKTSVRDKARRTEVMTHGFLDVWNRPNYFYTGRYFRMCCQQHLDLVGECVIVLVRIGGYVVEMWPVRPDRIKPVKHPTKFLTGYIYIGPDGEEVPLALDDVIHIKYPNPADPYRGMGPVQTALYDLDAARYSAQWNRNFFINGAQPGGVIEVDYVMGDKEWRAFLSRWNEQHRGVANAHRVAVLENAHWKDTKFSMEDMQFVQLRELPREIIREAFAFPKPMLGTVDDVNRANAEAGMDIMAKGQTIPRLSLWKDAVNVFLLPQFANGKALEHEPDDPTPINQEAQNAQLNSQSAAARNLALTGWHPDDVLEATRLPAMRWIGIPQPGVPAKLDEEDTAEPAQNVIRATAERVRPLIEIPS